MLSIFRSTKRFRVVTRLLSWAACAFVLFVGSSGQAQQVEPGKKKLPMPGEAFQLDGRDAFVILPDEVDAGTPWVWYAPTLKGLPGPEEVWMFERFLEAGIAIAGIDVGESYGSPSGTSDYSKLYKYLTTERGLSSKPVLLARSRGGLMLYSWAAAHADSVAAIAGIYPVCNLASYPGLDRASGAFGLSSSQLKAELPTHNPIDRLKDLAQRRVPIFHIHGDSDTIVPLEDNSAIMQRRYLDLGGEMEVQVVEGQGHNMWKGWFQSQRLVDFVVAHAKPASEMTSEPPAEQPLVFRDLFNGKDLAGWIDVNTSPETWSVRDGMLICTGKPIGVMRTDRQYENFIIEVEWRHMEPGGNSGMFLWSDAVPGRNRLPLGMEVQMLELDWVNQHRRADGALPPIAYVHGELFGAGGMTATPDNPRGTRSKSLENRCKGVGEWNRYVVVAVDGTVKLSVNGKFVNGIRNASFKKGYICLESEGREIHFRKLRIMELPGGLANSENTTPLLSPTQN